MNGPDLSFGSGDVADGVDQFGHGTHMAGIIAGHDPSVPLDPHTLANDAKRNFVGIAPGARIVNVKVAAPDGAVDVSQVIAGIDWVVAAPKHRRSQHPGAEPVVRHRRRAGLPDRPADVRGRERLEARHRRGGLGRQRRIRVAPG